MAVLALTCVQKNTQKNMDMNAEGKISNYVASLANKIQAERKQGLFGNIFSTGEAMQVSQKANQETENGVTAESSIFRLPSWSPEDLRSTWLCFNHVIPSLPETYPLCFTSASSVSVRLFLPALRNAAAYCNLFCCSSTCHFPLYHIPLFSVSSNLPK